MEKLSEQLLLDVANRLPGVLKRRYLDCFEQRGLNLNRPGFESLRKFVLRELNVMTSDYAQTFFKADEKEKSCDSGERTRGAVRVQQVAVKTDGSPSSLTNVRESETRNDSPHGRRAAGTNSPPLCFFGGDESRHFLGDCQKFTNLSHERRRQAVMDSERCLNCLSLGHVVRSCAFPSKYCRCGPKFHSKHAGTLHESFVPVSTLP